MIDKIGWLSCGVLAVFCVVLVGGCFADVWLHTQRDHFWVDVRCSNCWSKVEMEFPMGSVVHGSKSQCPNCGVEGVVQYISGIFFLDPAVE